MSCIYNFMLNVLVNCYFHPLATQTSPGCCCFSSILALTQHLRKCKTASKELVSYSFCLVVNHHHKSLVLVFQAQFLFSLILVSWCYFRNDLDMRFVDLVFGSQEFRGHPTYLSNSDSTLGSPMSSLISDFEDNPLFDPALLQQLFYTNGVSWTVSCTW